MFIITWPNNNAHILANCDLTKRYMSSSEPPTSIKNETGPTRSFHRPIYPIEVLHEIELICTPLNRHATSPFPNSGTNALDVVHIWIGFRVVTVHRRELGQLANKPHRPPRRKLCQASGLSVCFLFHSASDSDRLNPNVATLSQSNVCRVPM